MLNDHPHEAGNMQEQTIVRQMEMTKNANDSTNAKCSEPEREREKE